ncbi:MAG: Spy/CpxP family protein refolding chaperone [bacterium]
MKKSLLIALLIAVGSLSMASAGNHGCGSMRGANSDGAESCMQPLMMMPWEKVIKLADEIKLDKTQLDAIEKARNSLEEQNDALFEEMADLRSKLHETMTQLENADLETALDLSNKLSELRNQQRQNRIKSIFELKTILTPDQHERLRELLRENRHGWSGQRCFFENRPDKMRGCSSKEEAAPKQRTGRRMSGKI